MTDDPSPHFAPIGILVAMLPVSDPAVSASFYSTLLGLELRREFVVGGQVTGCSLSRADLPYALSLRRKSTLPAGGAGSTWMTAAACERLVSKGSPL